MALNTAEKNKNYYMQSYPDDLLRRAWYEEIAKLPLVEQCLQLDITHEKLEGLPYGKKPEIYALNQFSAQGFIGNVINLRDFQRSRLKVCQI